MNDKIHIRCATIDDLSQVSALFDQYRQFYEQQSDLTHAQEFIRNRIDRSESVIFLALDSTGTGTGFVQLYPIFSSVSMRRKWILNDLFVAVNYRRQGVGEALMQAATDFARDTGAKGLALETQVTNHGAQALYELLGWVKDTEFFVYSLELPGAKE